MSGPFAGHLQLVRAALDGRGVCHKWLDGSMPIGERERRVAAIQGTGLNLTAADDVADLDSWWNLAVEGQALDRAHRSGP